MTDTFDIVVVGGGIAGLTAGLTAARLGRSTLVITGDTLGGQLLTIERIDGYPGFPEGVPGYDLCPIAQEQAAEAGAEIRMIEATGLAPDGEGWTVTTPSSQVSARSVILATGTRLRALGVDGEDSLRGKGVSQCASCDAPLLRERDVVVAGGGDSALQEALTLAEHCASVTIVHHGDVFAAQHIYTVAAEAEPKIRAMPNSEIEAILGDAAVEGVRVRNLDSGAATELACAGAFVFVGLQPNTSLLEDRAALDDSGAIVTDAAMRTRTRGLFAAGTVRAGSAGRAAAAAGEGALAALAADGYLNDGRWPE